MATLASESESQPLTAAHHARTRSAPALYHTSAVKTVGVAGGQPAGNRGSFPRLSRNVRALPYSPAG